MAEEGLIQGIVSGPWVRGLNNWRDPELLEHTESIEALDCEFGTTGLFRRRRGMYGFYAPTDTEGRIVDMGNAPPPIVDNTASCVVLSENGGTYTATPRPVLIDPALTLGDAPANSGANLGEYALTGRAEETGQPVSLGVAGWLDKPALYAAANGKTIAWVTDDERVTAAAPTVWSSDTEPIWTTDEGFGAGEGEAAVEIGSAGGYIPPARDITIFSSGGAAWLVTAMGDTIRWSFPLSTDGRYGFQNFREQARLRLPLTGNDEITALFPYRHMMLVFTYTGIWQLHERNPEFWFQEQVSDKVGVSDRRGVQWTPYGVMFLDWQTNRLWAYSGGELSDLWHDRLRLGAEQSPDKLSLAFHGTRVYVSTSDTAPSSDRSLSYVMDMQTGSISRRSSATTRWVTLNTLISEVPVSVTDTEDGVWDGIEGTSKGGQLMAADAIENKVPIPTLAGWEETADPDVVMDTAGSLHVRDFTARLDTLWAHTQPIDQDAQWVGALIHTRGETAGTETTVVASWVIDGEMMDAQPIDKARTELRMRPSFTTGRTAGLSITVGAPPVAVIRAILRHTGGTRPL